MQANEQAQRTLREIGAAATVAGQGMAAALKPMMAAFVLLGRQCYAALWHAYIMDGAPYGETTKGLTRWVRERSR